MSLITWNIAILEATNRVLKQPTDLDKKELIHKTDFGKSVINKFVASELLAKTEIINPLFASSMPKPNGRTFSFDCTFDERYCDRQEMFKEYLINHLLELPIFATNIKAYVRIAKDGYGTKRLYYRICYDYDTTIVNNIDVVSENYVTSFVTLIDDEYEIQRMRKQNSKSRWMIYDGMSLSTVQAPNLVDSMRDMFSIIQKVKGI